MRISRFTCVSLAIALCLSATAAFGGDSSWNVNSDNVVLDGYDVVSYFTTASAVPGKAKHSVTYDGVVFHFASAENRDMFKQSPEKYTPKYGGFCAFAVAMKNAKVPTNPNTFKLYNGELLLFFNDLYEGKSFNTKVPWNGDERKLFATAEKNWRTLEKQ